MSDPFMVKVQRSIVTNHSTATMLIYDRDHVVEYEAPLSKDVAKAMGDRLRCFWWAILHEDGTIELQDKPYQNEDEGEQNFEQFSFNVMN